MLTKLKCDFPRTNLFCTAQAHLKHYIRKKVHRAQEGYDPFYVDEEPALNMAKISPVSTVFREVKADDGASLPLKDDLIALTEADEPTRYKKKKSGDELYVDALRAKFSLPETESGYFEPMGREERYKEEPVANQSE